MLRINQPALQVLKDGKFEYVFCRCNGAIVTTADRRKALNAKRDLAWFESKFGNDTFRSDREEHNV